MDIDTIDFVFPTIFYIVVTGIVTTLLYFVLGKPDLLECIIAAGVIVIGFNQLAFGKIWG